MNDTDKKQANLRVLQRLDVNVRDIICSATHVVLYEFSQTKQHWEKRNVEGSLFVTQQQQSEGSGSGGDDFVRFKLLVLNRSSTENLEVPITTHFQMQVREPYLIFRSPQDKKTDGGATIRGLWFHDNNERKTVSTYLEQIVEDVKVDKQTTPKKVAAPVVTTPERAPSVAATSNHSTGSATNHSHGITSFNNTINYNSRRTAPTPQTEVDVGAMAESLLSPLSLATQQQTHQPPDNNNNHLPPHTFAPETSSVTGSSAGGNPASVTAPAHVRNVVLDKKSLQLALLALIQDEKFLDLIHAQYLKVAHSRASKKDGSN